MRSSTFVERGGLWVAAQFVAIPLFVLVEIALRATGVERAWPSPFGVIASVCGVFIGLGALVLLARSVIDLGRNLTAFPKPLEDSTLVESGAYRYARHPIYASIALAMFAIALFFNSLIGLAFAALTFVFFDRKAAHEERLLMAKHPGYAAYRMRVKKLIPFVY